MKIRQIIAIILAMLLLGQTALAAGRKSGFDGFSRSRTYEGQFTDVAEDIWYYRSVADAYELGLMDGTRADTFSPDESISVAELLTLACRLLSIYSGDEADFTGTPWYTPYVNYAVEEGLIARSQFSDYTAPATRADAAAVLGVLPESMLASVNDIQDNAIPDVAPGSTYYAPVYTLYRAGVLTGSDAAGSFLPDSTVARCEAAAIVVRLADPSQRQSVELSGQPVTLHADNGDRITVSPGEAAAYEAMGWQRSPFTVPSGGGAEAVLNAATLRPRTTGADALDKAVDDILTGILTDGMTTYEKVRACYDYLIGHVTDGSGTLRISGRGPYQNSGDYTLVLRAQDVLEKGVGTSEDYAAAFLVLTRRIGLSCYVVDGEASRSGGGWTGHSWNIITVGGTDYVFDVHADDAASSGANTAHYRFCRTFDQVSQSYRDYDAESAKSGFGNFTKQ